MNNQNKSWETLTVGSVPTSCVIPAVAPTVFVSSLRKTHEDVATSENGQVRHANIRVLSTLFSFG